MPGKKALLIGINYTSIPNITLRGCINDIVHIRCMLMDAYDYDGSNIVSLRDDIAGSSTQPTKNNILANMKQLAVQSSGLDEIWIHYSGHGTQLPDKIQASGYNDVIVPLDYSSNGFVTNHELYSVLKTFQCRTILCFDSCHDAAVCELPWSYQYNSPGKFTQIKNNTLAFANPNIFMFSGCRDTQTCADEFNKLEVQYEGAFTEALIACLRASHHNIGFMAFFQAICTYLANGGYSQIPVFSSSSQTPNLTFVRALTLYSSSPNPTATTNKQAVTGLMRSILYA